MIQTKVNQTSSRILLFFPIIKILVYLSFCISTSKNKDLTRIKTIPEYCREFLNFYYSTPLHRSIFGTTPSLPTILNPTCPELERSGYKRPVWIALIAFFFSKNFIVKAIRSAFWPISLYVSESHLPHFGIGSFFLFSYLILS